MYEALTPFVETTLRLPVCAGVSIFLGFVSGFLFCRGLPHTVKYLFTYSGLLLIGAIVSYGLVTYYADVVGYNCAYNGVVRICIRDNNFETALCVWLSWISYFVVPPLGAMLIRKKLHAGSAKNTNK